MADCSHKVVLTIVKWPFISILFDRPLLMPSNWWFIKWFCPRLNKRCHVVSSNVFTDRINVLSCITRNGICSILIIDTNTNMDLFTSRTVVARIDQTLLEPISHSLKWMVVIQNKRSKLLKVNGQKWNWTWSVHERGRTRDQNGWPFDHIIYWTWFESRSLSHNGLTRSVQFRVIVYRPVSRNRLLWTRSRLDLIGQNQHLAAIKGIIPIDMSHIICHIIYMTDLSLVNSSFRLKPIDRVRFK